MLYNTQVICFAELSLLLTEHGWEETDESDVLAHAAVTMLMSKYIL